MSTQIQPETVFEFDFVAPKPSTKVDSVFDLVNGNGQHTAKPEPKHEHVVDDAGPLSTEWNDTYDSPPWSTKPEAKLQDADSALEFDHSETLEPTSDIECLGHDGYVAAVNAELDKQKEERQQQQDEDDLEADYQSRLRKWNRDYEQAKIDWEKLKHETEQEQISLALEVKRISDGLKEVRQSHKSVIATLEDLNKVGPAYPERPIKGQDPQPPKPPAELAPSGKPAKKQPNVDESWKAIKAETFLSLEIEGMGQKKLDILLHEYPTLGDWVELQTEASKKCIHLSKLLPKGVGKKLADSIDNAAMDAFRDHAPPA